MKKTSKILEYDKENTTNEESIFLFCDFISSNPQFKYNDTYLKDLYITFKEKVELLKYRNEILKQFQIILVESSQTNDKGFIILFDDTLLIDSHNLGLIQYIDDFQKDSFTTWIELRKSISGFNLYNLSEKELIVRFWSSNFEDVYIISFNNNIKEIVDIVTSGFINFRDEIMIKSKSKEMHSV